MSKSIMVYIARLKRTDELMLLAEIGLEKGENVVFTPNGLRVVKPYRQFDPKSEKEVELSSPEITPAQREAYKDWEPPPPPPKHIAPNEPPEGRRPDAIPSRVADHEVLLGVRALERHLRPWFLRTSGECRLDGKGFEERGGVSAILRVRINGFDDPLYDTEYNIASDTRRSAVGVFLARYEQFQGDVNLIFSKEWVNSHNGRPKLGLSGEVRYWNCLERM